MESSKGCEEPVSRSSSSLLVDDLKAAGRKQHDANNALVMGRIVILFTNRRLYGAALHVFYVVLSTLEEALEEGYKHDKQYLATLAPTARKLYRAKRFAEDLEYFWGPSWQEELAARPLPRAVAEYCAHLRSLGEPAEASGGAKSPTLLIAHAFTQLLGMTAGGQIVRRQARKHMGLPEDRGTAAFEFGEENPSKLAADFKEQVNQLGTALPQPVYEQVIAEHLLAFRANIDIIRGFHIPLWAYLAGLFRMVPVMTWVSIALLLLALWARMRSS